jgi:endonuclease III
VIDHSDRFGDAPVVLKTIALYPRIVMNAATKIIWIATQLAEQFGTPKIELIDPIENLVLTILSQNTNDNNRDRAFASLMSTFETFDRIRLAPIDEVAKAIQVGGLQQQKSRSIQKALQQIRIEQGNLELAFLNELSLFDALKWLTGLPGVGPKTAGIVLLFSFERPYFPADTHIRRIMIRMGLVPERGDPHSRLNELLPADSVLMQRLHLLTIQLGRELCHPRNPNCEQCSLQPECLWTKMNGSTSTDRVTSPIDRGGNH